MKEVNSDARFEIMVLSLSLASLPGSGVNESVRVFSMAID